MRRVQLISRHLPWTVVVENPNGVCIGDVLFRIRACLHKTIHKTEFEAVGQDYQAEILKAYQRNCSGLPGLPPRQREEGLKRVDWLGKRTVFAGIQKDDKLINARVRDHAARLETFVLDFAYA